MDTDGNKQITFEEFLSLLKQEKDSLESQMAEKFGMKIYKSADGFTQEEIYDYAGAKDCVATLTLTQESAKEYGESLTVTFVYYQKDRIALEKDKTALNDIPNVKAKELLGELDDILHAKLLKDGIPTQRRIIPMLVLFCVSLKYWKFPLRVKETVSIFFLCMGPYLILFLMESD